MRFGIKQIVFIILSVFLIKISIADPMRENKRKVQKRNPASVSYINQQFR